SGGSRGRTSAPCYTPARLGTRGNRPAPPPASEITRGPFRPGRCRPREAPHGATTAGIPATRSAEERTEQEVLPRAVRLDAAAARSRCPLRPPDAPLESQDAPLHLRGAQRDPHHRSRPDRQAPRLVAGIRPRDGRPWRVR